MKPFLEVSSASSVLSKSVPNNWPFLPYSDSSALPIKVHMFWMKEGERHASKTQLHDLVFEVTQTPRLSLTKKGGPRWLSILEFLWMIPSGAGILLACWIHVDCLDMLGSIFFCGKDPGPGSVWVNWSYCNSYFQTLLVLSSASHKIFPVWF